MRRAYDFLTQSQIMTIVVGLVAVVFEFVNRAAPFFRSIRGEFHTIKAEVCAAQQFQFTHHENIAED